MFQENPIKIQIEHDYESKEVVDESELFDSLKVEVNPGPCVASENVIIDRSFKCLPFDDVQKYGLRAGSENSFVVQSRDKFGNPTPFVDELFELRLRNRNGSEEVKDVRIQSESDTELGFYFSIVE